MASFVEYRENAAECARLALIAPSKTGTASFDAAAKHWMMLHRLAAESETAESPDVRFEDLRNKSGTTDGTRTVIRRRPSFAGG